MANPAHLRGDENAPPGKNNPSSNPAMTSASKASVTVPPTEETLTQAPDYRPKAHVIHMPYYQPPYESPIDGRICHHFDDSEDYKQYCDEQGKVKFPSFTKAFYKKWHDLNHSIAPPLFSSLEIRTCVTGASRATTPDDMEPERSPPFFAVSIDQAASPRLDQIYQLFKGFLEVEFPQRTWPECYQNDQILIRLFAIPRGVPF
ncbi:uncharacterized protein RCC_05971 [Ramularia collo-cygni]|uniref:Uncharacterized protein n=1 Tax=Ramularia collo-cygni TaxID=112498 RepID=A0A2D3VBM4_9PEZI|nr:uncharacterized protein RCC_05971 [Ramularia collo-cygni]CZT20114.1 uncharacterized protein RCC_05971 [Ramularia collo-cygni]